MSKRVPPIGSVVWYATDGGECANMAVRPFQGEVIEGGRFLWGPDCVNVTSLDSKGVFTSFDDAMAEMRTILWARLERGRAKPFSNLYRTWVIGTAKRALREKHGLTVEDLPDDDRCDEGEEDGDPAA